MVLNKSQIWEIQHMTTVLTELKTAGIELKKENISSIIDYMSFKNRSKRDTSLCPQYKGKNPKPCHEVKDLNCFLCACPNYESEKLEGGCKINSKKGKFHYHKNLPKGMVWDCSDCNINHSPKEIEKYLLKNLEKLIKMSEKI
jgi:Zn-finger protein